MRSFTNLLKGAKNAPKDAKQKELENYFFNYLLSLPWRKKKKPTTQLMNNAGVSKWALKNIFRISQIY